MRPGDPAGRADLADGIAGRDILARHHVDARHVHVGRREAVTMVDDDRAAGQVEIALGEPEQGVGQRDGHQGACVEDYRVPSHQVTLSWQIGLGAFGPTEGRWRSRNGSSLPATRVKQRRTSSTGAHWSTFLRLGGLPV